MDISLLKKNGYLEFRDIEIESLIDVLTTAFREFYAVEYTPLLPNCNSSKFQFSLSKEFGMSAFPFHTDGAHRLMPPRWIILEYKGLNHSKSATTLLDTESLQNEPLNERFFFNDVYMVSGGKTSFLTTVVNKIQFKIPILRWNPLTMKRLSSKRNDNLDIFDPSFGKRIEWEQGKLVVIDNWRVLHGREPVEKEEEMSRLIHRYNLTPIN